MNLYFSKILAISLILIQQKSFCQANCELSDGHVYFDTKTTSVRCIVGITGRFDGLLNLRYVQNGQNLSSLEIAPTIMFLWIETHIGNKSIVISVNAFSGLT